MYSLRNYIDIIEGKPINEAPVAAFGQNAAAAPAAAAPAQPAPAAGTTAALDQQKKGIAAGAPGATPQPAPAAPANNPYTGADAEKFARLSPEDQAWYTKGGGKPDLNDPNIAARAPNKGQLGAAPAAAPAGGSPTTTAPSGAAQPAAASSGAAAGGAGAAAQPAPAGAAQPAAGSAGGAAGAAQPASGAVAAFGQNAGTPAPAASDTGEVPGVTTQSGATPAPAPAAAPAPADAPAAAPANRDAMPFGKAFADARAKGEKEFTWKGKKYAVTMAAPKQSAKQAATPAPAAPAQQPGMWDRFKNWATGGGNPAQTAGGGQISNTPAAENIQMNEFDMDIDRIMKNMGAVNKPSQSMPKIDPANIQNSINDIKKGIMGNMDDMGIGKMDKQDDTSSTAPGANVPNPPTQDKLNPKDLLKNIPDADIQKLSGDDAKVLLAQLKKLAGM